jgi:hypothetical protein
MRPEPEERPFDSLLPPVRQDQVNPPDQSDLGLEGGSAPQTAAPMDRRDRAVQEEHRRPPCGNPRWRVRRSSADRKAWRRLGPLEYLLFALIALSVAITMEMAIFNPSG